MNFTNILDPDYDSKYRAKKFVLIDDDQTYREIMVRVAKLHGVELDVFESMRDIQERRLLGKYDAILLDYDLGECSGIQIARELSERLGDLPILLISGLLRTDDDVVSWPDCIKGFVQKSEGYNRALEKVSECTHRQVSCIVSQAF